MPEVRQERTGWRDLGLSERHRKWGWDCPAVDLDFLFIEYDRGKATAIIEYKNEKAEIVSKINANIQAQIDLADRAGIPFFVCRYKSDFSKWKVSPMNDEALKRLPKETVMYESGWVRFLYELRGYKCPQKVLDDLKVEV